MYPEPWARRFTQPEACHLGQSMSIPETSAALNHSQSPSTRGPRKGASGDHRFRISAAAPWCLHGLGHNLSLAALPPNPAETKSAALTSPSQFLISSQPDCWLLIKSWEENLSLPFLPLFLMGLELLLFSGK